MSELLLLFTNVVSEWTAVQERKKSHLSDVYTLGYRRMEVLAVFSSMIVAHLGAIFIIKETLERSGCFIFLSTVDLMMLS